MGGAGAVLRSFVLVLAAAFALMSAGSALAVTFTVNSTEDFSEAQLGDGDCLAANDGCTLRAAVEEANAYPGNDVINVPAGTYVLTID